MLSCIVAFTSFWSCSTSSCIFTLHVRFQSIYNFVVLIVSNVSSLCWSLFTIKGFFGEFFLIQIVVCGKQIINSLEPNLWFVNSGYINKINLSCTLIRFLVTETCGLFVIFCGEFCWLPTGQKTKKKRFIRGFFNC